MLDHTLNQLRERVLKWFPERQFFHRTGGEVNFFVLGTRTQVALVTVVAFILLWCVITLGNVLWGQNPFRSSAKELRVQKEHYERYMVNLQAQETSTRELLAEQQKQFQLAAENFESKHNTIVAMITQGGIADKPAPANSANASNSVVMMSPIAIQRIEPTALASLDLHNTLETGTVLDASMVKLEQDQNRILIEGEEKILDDIDHFRAVLLSTGVDIRAVLKNGMAGMGGPIVEVEETANMHTNANDEFPSRLETIRARASEVASLKAAVASAPLGFPIDAESYQTSGYGIRKDPFTNRPTKHPGLDIASYRLAPIVATADGKVSFSGTRAGYGRVIEVDHGHGFKTRYAHLAKTHVKRGAEVKKGDKIGGMGSTGRSTSTHLHYEILFENRTYDPNQFIKAGKYVQ